MFIFYRHHKLTYATEKTSSDPHPERENFSNSPESALLSVQLPFSYVEIPGPKDPPANRSRRLKFYVNKVITNLSIAAFNHAGFDQTEDPRDWNASWGRQYTSPQYKKCLPFQKINHYAGANLMGRKDNLHTRMLELRERVGDFASFYPQSYLLPGQRRDLVKNWKNCHLWISKPSASSRGRGIHVLSSDTRIIPDEPGIIQAYIERPLLITGRKFDIRLYVLVSSISPLKIYVHDSGLGRFATHSYDSDGSITDLHMHLTNFSINKTDKKFIRGAIDSESVENSKWSLPFLLEHLRGEGIDTQKLMAQIESAVAATVIAGVCAIRPYHQNLIKGRYTSYEMYGFDVMLDEDLKPYVIEVNISPSMSGLDSQLDYDVKWRLMLELLEMARIIDCDTSIDDPCPGLAALESAFGESLSPERITEVQRGKVNPWDSPVFADIQIIRDLLEDERRKGGFRRIFPKRKTMSSLIRCFDEVDYSDIVLERWVEMDAKGRSEAIERGLSSYRERIARMLSKVGRRSNRSNQ